MMNHVGTVENVTMNHLGTLFQHLGTLFQQRGIIFAKRRRLETG
jgi:hypothetical protein